MNSLHLELTTRCVLECPGCPRTWFSQTFKRPVPHQDIELDVLINTLDCPTGSLIDHFHLESNHGDSIYYPQLLQFLEYWRTTKKFTIVTNGSRRKIDFWKRLNSILTDQDEIVFSIDGLEHNNHLYRKNSDWTTLIDAVKTAVDGPAKITWKTIVFSYNENEIDQIKNYATSIGVDKFLLVNSNRFGDNYYVPSSQHIDASKLYVNSKHQNQIAPKCNKTSHQTYITPDGYCWPCCWITSYFTLHKTELWKNRKMFDLRLNSLDQILENIENFSIDVKNNPHTAHSVCKMMCSIQQK
jgi:MoaA/NifB/PqqE/SkfB family radical SAM enzyme